jgi:pectate lyase
MSLLGRSFSAGFVLCLLSGCGSPADDTTSDSGGATGTGAVPSALGGSGGARPGSGGSAATTGGSDGQGTGGQSDTPTGGSGGTAAEPLDCSALANAGFEVCEATSEHCAAVFTDGAGCVDVCEAAGLKCAGAYDNVDGSCAATTAEVACNSGHQSDYCVCDETGGGLIVDPPDPPLGPVVTGYASTSSNGLTTTTGGGNAAPNTVTTCADLKSYLADAQARVIEIPAGTTLDCRTAPRTQQACELQCSNAAATPVYWRIPVTGQSCTTLADTNGDGKLDVPAGKLVNKERREVSMKVGSNKTLRGLGSGATLLGVSLDIENQSNIILQNLKISEVNPDLVEAGDGVTINSSHHVWVDHCEFSMISDGYLDIRYGSSAVTVSNNHIVGKNQYVCGGQHHYISLVSDSQATFHHNYFDHPSGRNPKVADDSQVHLYSNYYDGVTYFCANAGTGAEVLVEGNYYKDSRYPHWVDGGQIEASGNQYAGSTSADHRDSNANLPAPPYSYQLDAVSTLPTSVPAAAGPGDL